MNSWSRIFRILKGCLLTFFGICFIAIFAVLRSVEYSQTHREHSLENTIWKDHPKSNNLITQMKIFPQGGDEISLKPQWEIPEMKVVNDSERFLEDGDEKFVATNFSFSPGLGNIMFQYASLFGIAKRHGAELIVPDNLLLRRAFRISATAVTSSVFEDIFEAWKPRRVFSDCCRYYNESEEVEVNKTIFMGYFQSFKYFLPFAKQLRKEMEFLPFVRQKAQSLIQNAIQSMKNLPSKPKNNKQKERNSRRKRIGGQPKSNVHISNDLRGSREWTKDFSKYGSGNRTLIGVHIRRGMDISWNLRNMEHGHVIAPKRYVFNAMNYYRKRFGNPIFIVCTDNPYWCKQNLVADDVVLVSSGAREIDLCVLSLCDHTIMSQGTFSWWAAYLAGGEAVYYKNWPRPGSQMDMMTRKQDYFLPHWVGMD